METIRNYGAAKIAELLDGFLKELTRCKANQDEEPVHKLRVSVRRLQQGLRIFRQFVDKKASKEIRQQLKELIHLAGEIRERDIALKLLEEGNAATIRLTEERDAARTALKIGLKRLKGTKRWKGELGVESA